MNTRLKISLFAALLVPALSSASLIGDNVTANFHTTINNCLTPTVPFAASATVGAGTEFSGHGVDCFGQQWDIFTDVTANGFTVRFNELTRGGAGNVWDSEMLVIDLGSLDLGTPITGIINSGFSTTYNGANADISQMSSTATTATVGFRSMRSGDFYTFDLLPEAVPEPGTLALFGLGLVGFGAFLRRKK